MDTLFGPDFLAAVARLSFRRRRVGPRPRHGEYASARAGTSLEFREFQPYTPGDDLRRVDWNVYSRTGHVVVRRNEHLSPTTVRVCVDASASMFFESTPRYATAARLAGAIASAGVRSQDRVFVRVLGDASAAGPAVTSPGRLMTLFEQLSDARPTSLGLADALGQDLPSRPGEAAVIVSDFFDNGGASAIIAALGRWAGRLLFVQITQPTDRRPPLDAEAELIDCETGERLTVAGRDDVLRRYAEAYDAYFATLRDYAHGRGAAWVNVDAAADLPTQIDTLFPDGTLDLS